VEKVSPEIYRALQYCDAKQEEVRGLFMDMANREKFTEVIFKNIRDGVLILDRNYRILAVNNSVGKWIEKPVD
jgi:PAS domain-containing protein